MSAFENIVIGKNSIPSLIITVILMIAIPVISFIYWRKRHKQQTKISWLIAGAVGFFVSARVLELGIHYFCIIADNPVSRFINGNTAAFVLYGITMAGGICGVERRGNLLPSDEELCKNGGLFKVVLKHILQRLVVGQLVL